MASFQNYRDDYERIWGSLQIRPEKSEAVRKLAQRLVAGKTRYQEVEARTGVPWWFVGLCHYRESSFNFDTYLGNGQPLDRRTTIVPKGRGPFTGPTAFTDGAVDALRLEGFVGVRDWSAARVLYRLEGFNGYGYHAKGVNSPYLWGGSTAYGPPNARGGKFVRDHVFDPSVVDTQLGTAVILKALLDLDPSIPVAGPHAADVESPREPDDELAESTLWVQHALNRLGTVPQLVEDGRNGRRTMDAVAQFQAQHGLNETGVADARTVAAIQEASRPAAPQTEVLARIDSLERHVAAGRAVTPQVMPMQPMVVAPAAIAPATVAPTVDLAARVDELFLALRRQIDGARLAGAPQAPVTASTTGPGAVLGQVNGALGQTIGQLLDGKKSAIGIIGAVATQILAQVPATTGLGQVLAQLTPAFGLSPYTLPIFLGLTAWGVLGKLEKWAGPAAKPAPQGALT
jgi:lysozyme family protein/peptidoglycan hydrolase-like protein with peptidoglycan-binding domain